MRNPRFSPVVVVVFLLTSLSSDAEASSFLVPGHFGTIQAAIDYATNGDEIIVAPGTYTVSLKMKGKDLHLHSQDPTNLEVVRATVLAGNGSNIVVEFNGSETSDCVLTGFTITGGTIGISGRSTRATLERNIIRNQSERGIENTRGTVRNTILWSNHGSDLYNVSGNIEFCIIDASNRSNPYPVWNAGRILRNCIIWGTAAGSNGLNFGTSPQYCCIQNYRKTETNFTDDPRFVDPENGDFRLLPNSPCIDAGSSVTKSLLDFVGIQRGYDAIDAPRGNGSDVDVGVFEFIGAATLDHPPLQATNLLPASGETEILIIPTLVGGTFEDPDPSDRMGGSQWQISDIPDFATPLFTTSPDTILGVTTTIPSSVFETSSTYYWRVRYRDVLGAWGDWSAPTWFRTRGDRTIRVPEDYPSLSEVMVQSSCGDEVIVATGTYRGPLKFHGEDVWVHSIDPDDPRVVGSTIILGSNTVDTAVFQGTESENCRLEGFTLINGRYGVNGHGTHATVSQNVISRNRYGITNSTGIIRSNTFQESQNYGVVSCTGLISGNCIRNNGSNGINGCTGIIENNLILNNGVSGIDHSSGLIRNNVLYGNYQAIGINVTSSLSNNIIWNNRKEEVSNRFTFCCIDSWDKGGEGNFSFDPLFRDPEGGDFRLGALSPCIDSGTDAAGISRDYDGNPRPANAGGSFAPTPSKMDIGPFEVQEPVAPDTPPHPPSILLPADGSNNLAPSLVLKCTGFSDIDEGDLFTGAQWQVSSQPDFSTPVYDSGLTLDSEVEHPVNILDIGYGATYYCQVRHRDNHGRWGDWSQAITFTTLNLTRIDVRQDYPTVQAAIDAATNWQEVVVHPGRYIETLRIEGKEIILRSLDPTDPSMVANTIIDASRMDSVITLGPGTSSHTVIAGLTLTNGNSYSGGGGVGGGGSLANLFNNRIVGNNANESAGVENIKGRISGNLISRNTSTSYSGGLGFCSGLIDNNIICYNQSSGVSAIYCLRGNIVNNTIAYNVSRSSAAVAIQEGTYVNNIVWGNTPAITPKFGSRVSSHHSCIEGWPGTEDGHLPFEPLFLDPESENFHLLPTSPCIDSGMRAPDVVTDFEGNPRPYSSSPQPRGDGSGYDIGAFEFTGAFPLNMPPHSPINLFPPSGGTNTFPIPILTASPFGDSDPGQFHLLSHWQISDSTSFLNTKFDSGEELNQLEQFEVPDGILRFGETYYWRVRYADSMLVWSEWSVPTGFTVIDFSDIRVPDDFATIQQAIDSATSGETIVVAPGTYIEDLTFQGKNIVLRSIDPDDGFVVDRTRLQGTIAFKGTEGPACQLAGFKVHGSVTGNAAKPSILRNHLRNLQYNNSLIVDNCDGLIAWNRFEGESSDHRPVVNGCDGTIDSNVFESINLSNGNSGVLNKCQGTVRNNLLAHNSLGYSPGVIVSCNGVLENNTLIGNSIKSPFTTGKTIGLFDCDGIIRNCIVWGGLLPTGPMLLDCAEPTYCCIENWDGGGEGNISFAPNFINAASDNFHLRPNSPCIDSGSPVSAVNDDIEGTPRPFPALSPPRETGSAWDIGAYEFVGAAAAGTNPNPPQLLYPEEDMADVSTIFRMAVDNEFTDADGWDYLHATQWQIDDQEDFADPIFDTGVQSQHLFEAIVPRETLAFGTHYRWRVRFFDSSGLPSEWSEGAFTTRFSPAVSVLDPDRWLSLQEEILAAQDGDWLILPPGVYEVNLRMEEKNITLSSLDPFDPEIVESTVLDGKMEAATIALSGTETSQCVITGLTIRNGKPGVAGNHCTATLQRNVITENEAGVVYVDGLIEGNTISHNHSKNGGGLLSCQGTIQNNLILHNQAKRYCGYTGGSCIPSSHDPDCIVTFPYYSCDYGLGGGAYDCNGIVVCNTFYKNDSYDGGGIASCYGTIRNNILWENAGLNEITRSATAEFCCIRNRIDLENENLFVDPEFINAASGDFRLRPTSPCIDSGGVVEGLDDDILANPRPFEAREVPRGDGSHFDMGAYEFVGVPEGGNPPAPPYIVYPRTGDEGVLNFPLLQVGPFVDSDEGDTHLLTQWQLDDGTGGDMPYIDSGPDLENLTSYQVGVDRPLLFNKLFWWRARFMDSAGDWSGWSEIQSFRVRPRPPAFYVPEEFPTIQSAISLSTHGDEIVVATGVYQEYLHFQGKDIVLRSLNPLDPKIVEATVITGNPPNFDWCSPYGQTPPVVAFRGTEGADCGLLGFTITKGCNPKGSGINGNGTLATIAHNHIVNNRSRAEPKTRDHLGGGIYRCNGLIVGNVVENNLSNIGAGLYDCGGVIERNIITYNTCRACQLTESNGYRYTTGAKGGALAYCDGIIRNNLIFCNGATFEGGACYECDGDFINNTFYSNSTWDEGGAGLEECHGDIVNNVMVQLEEDAGVNLQYSTIPRFCCIDDWYGGGEGNITADPMFINAASGDFRVKVDSPCIDSGGAVDLGEDIQGNPRPIDLLSGDRGDGSNFDIGAYEVRVFSNDRIDINQDLRVDFLDLFLFQESWEQAGKGGNRSDMNRDSDIDIYDLLILIEGWEEATSPSGGPGKQASFEVAPPFR